MVAGKDFRLAQVLPFKIATAQGSSASAPVKQNPFLGDLLVKSGALAPAALSEALAMQQEQDTLLGQILLVHGLITPDALLDALSVQSNLGRVDLYTQKPDPTLLAEIDPYLCLRLEAIPWRKYGGRIVIAIANPALGLEVLDAFSREGEQLALAIERPEAIRRAISEQFGPQMVRDAENRCPHTLSCRSIVAGHLTLRKLLILGMLAAIIAFAPVLALQVAIGWVLVANLMTMGLRLVAIFARMRNGRASTKTAVPRLVDYRRLPRVSVLVPLKSEAAIAGHLLAALGRMEYPAPLLDIKLVLEAGDTDTLAAIEHAGLPPTIEVVIVPRGSLQTKPRAMNYALPFCKGEIVGVYDAEDRPDPGQIRAVVQHLQEAPANVACVQGYLDFYNTKQNWLSRCFTIEYAVWFRVILLGVQRLGLPIPLGGTTVFFRRRVLEEIGAWDAHNVTEDADLGMRLERFGYHCEMIATTTEEEANCEDVGRWVRQRSRWLKGYAITWATHMRDPVALLRDLGWRGFLGFQVLLLGGLTSYLAIPLFWLLWTGAFGFDFGFWDKLNPLMMTAFIAVMVAGQAVMMITAAIALVDSGRARMIPWIVTLSPYWLFGAAAAYRAVAELFYAPFHWHKTEHGQSLKSRFRLRRVRH